MNRRNFIARFGGCLAGAALAHWVDAADESSATASRAAGELDLLGYDGAACTRNAMAVGPRLKDLLHGLGAPAFQLVAVKGDTVVLNLVSGTETPGGGRVAVADTIFNVGSVSKPVTAAVLLKLCEMGKASVSDPVAAHLPRYPWPDHTLRHLLTHTAGFLGEDEQPWPAKAEQMAAFRDAIYKPRILKHKPGEITHYFSSGYVVLLDVVERLGGKPLEAMAREWIFDPLGMRQTTFDRSAVGDRAFAPWDGARLQTEVLHAPTTGDTGMMSTAHDVVRLGLLLRGRGLLRGRQVFEERTIQAMLSDEVAKPFGRTINFWLRGPAPQMPPFGDSESARTVGHPGYTGCCFAFDPERDTCWALVSNGMAVQASFDNYRRVRNLLDGCLA